MLRRRRIKRGDKRKAQIRHALRRLRERYAVRLSDHDVITVINMIQNRDNAICIAHQSGRVTVHDVMYKGTRMRLLYDKNRGSIITAFPPDSWSERWIDTNVRLGDKPQEEQPVPKKLVDTAFTIGDDMNEKTQVFRLKQKLQAAKTREEALSGKLRAQEVRNLDSERNVLKSNLKMSRREIKDLEDQQKALVYDKMVSDKELLLARTARDEAQELAFELIQHFDADLGISDLDLSSLSWDDFQQRVREYLDAATLVQPSKD